MFRLTSDRPRKHSKLTCLHWRHPLSSPCQPQVKVPRASLLGRRSYLECCMRLESVSVSNFRSLAHAILPDLGAFNVLIGKNNSGKSNLLTAIDTFFTTIHDGQLIDLRPSIGKTIDFHRKNKDTQITTALIFSLSAEDHSALIADISQEAPNMHNAAEAIDPSHRLSATIAIFPEPNSYAYVQQLSLHPASGPAHSPSTPSATLLHVDQFAAAELYARLSFVDQLAREVEALRHLDSERLRRYRSRDQTSSSFRPPISSLLIESGFPGTPNLIKQLEDLTDSVTSYDALRQELEALASRKQDEIDGTTGSPLERRIKTFAGDDDHVPQYVYNILGRLATINVLHLTDRRKPIGSEEAAQLLKLKTRRGGPDVLRTIQETVSALLGVQVDAFESDQPAAPRRSRAATNYVYDDPRFAIERGTPAELDVDDFLVQVNGAGIREALRVILDCELRTPQLLLVEEPEVHLHPALEVVMLNYLQQVSDDCQIVLTSHSTNFVDNAGSDHIYLVDSLNNSTRVKLLTQGEVADRLPSELGIRLSSLFMFEKLVFIEGPVDEAIIRAWATVLGVNLGQSNVGFITIGGARNFSYFAAEATLSFLQKRQVQLWFLIDRDERDPDELQKMRERLGDAATVVVLEAREIENYLIHPRALREFIDLKRGMAGMPALDEKVCDRDIERLIDETADKLKSTTISNTVYRRICRPLFPPPMTTLDGRGRNDVIADLKSAMLSMREQVNEAVCRIEEVYSEAADYIEDDWSDRKLSLVPGDMLLDAVCQEFGIRFKKSRDGARLASLMCSDEIAADIRAVIQEIGRTI